MKAKQELLAKYFATLSQIIFGAVILKQFSEQFDLAEFCVGITATLFFIIIAYIIQPKT